MSYDVCVVDDRLMQLCLSAAELGDSGSDTGKEKTKRKRCTLCKKRVGLTGQ